MSKPLPPDAPDTLSAEERMRRALGLTGDHGARIGLPRTERPQAGPSGRPAGQSAADKPRHRFVQDGDVPVTILNRHRPDETDGLAASRAAMEAPLQDERAARAKAERSLGEALATVHDLQTKLGHAELAHREASAAAQAARAEADILRAEHQEQALRWTQDLAAERAARAAAEAALAEAASVRGPARRTRPSASAVQPVPRPAGRPAGDQDGSARQARRQADAQDRRPAPAAGAAAREVVAQLGQEALALAASRHRAARPAMAVRAASRRRVRRMDQVAA